MKNPVSAILLLSTLCIATGEVDERLPWTGYDESVKLGWFLSGCVSRGHTVLIAIHTAPNGPVVHGEFSVTDGERRLVSRGTMRDGELDGPVVHFGERGEIDTLEVFRNGVPTGDRVQWDASGRVRHIVSFNESGRMNGTERFFEQGLVSREVDWDDGHPIVVREFEGDVVRRTYSGDEMLEMLIKRRIDQGKEKAAQPGATDNPDDAQRLREDH